MHPPIRNASETALSFDARLLRYLCLSLDRRMDGAIKVERDAGTVYAEGVHAGLSLAIAALQRRERIIDYLKRWEHQLRLRQEREHGR